MLNSVGWKKFVSLLAMTLLILISGTQAQKVGVVLSGGGGSGLAHIGFIRALEENNIPIDYISGTSMGALVGALYASGYSTEEMEAIFKSDQFKLWASGKIDDRYVHYFKKLQDDASWVKLKVSPDSILESNLPTNIINSTSLDFGLAEIFSGPSAASKDNFDDLMIPFRCLASDITTKQSYTFRNGDLPTAIRASISYPFYLNPISVDGKLLYDGGLYDNFPVSTLCEEFEPDYIIGSNVSYNFEAPEEDNVLSQIRSMMSYDTEYEINCEKGFVIEPPASQVALLDFSNVEGVVKIGYDATIEKIDSIKMYLPARRDSDDLKSMRQNFRQKEPSLKIKKIQVEGLSQSEEKYILKSLRFKEDDELIFQDFESEILKLASDDKILRIYPQLIFSDSLQGFILNLKVKKGKNFFISFGGNISTMAVNEGFVGLQYNNLSSVPMTLYGNTYFGKFYSSGHGLVKFDFPTFLPFQMHGSYTFNKWDYFQNSAFLIEESSPSYLIQRESYAQAGLTFPVSYKGKLGFNGNFGNVKYEYYQDNEFTRFDTTDITRFDNTTLYSYFERNSLNRKQYANKGSYFLVKGSFTTGHEETTPGHFGDSIVELDHEWFRIKARFDQYFSAGRFKYGFMAEGVYSDQPFFSNYASTLLSTPGFEPIPESKTIFRSKFRAHQYGAVGIRAIYTPIKNLDARLEGFMFQPLKEIVVNSEGNVAYDDVVDNRYFIGSFTLVYDLNFTQIAVNFNYYDNFNEEFPRGEPENYTIMFHLGYILFNQKMME